MKIYQFIFSPRMILNKLENCFLNFGMPMSALEMTKLGLIKYMHLTKGKYYEMSELVTNRNRLKVQFR